jgi:hypothetical protein
MLEYQLKTVSEVAPEAPELSVFLPVFNEAENVELLHEKLTSALEQLGRSYEIIYAPPPPATCGYGSSPCAAITGRRRR